MRHDHRAAAAAPGSASAPARRCVNTGPAPTAPPPFSAAAFFPEPSPHPPGRMRHLAAAAAGRTPGRRGQCAHAPRVPSRGLVLFYPWRGRGSPERPLGNGGALVCEDSRGRLPAPFAARWVLAQRLSWEGGRPAAVEPVAWLPALFLPPRLASPASRIPRTSVDAKSEPAGMEETWP